MVKHWLKQYASKEQLVKNNLDDKWNKPLHSLNKFFYLIDKEDWLMSLQVFFV